MEASTASKGPSHSGAARAAEAWSTRRGVSAIGIGARRRCQRDSCSEPATATLVFSYDEQVARIVGLLDDPQPQTYDLCGTHADRTSPPRGWELADTRPPVEDAPRRLDDEDTVAVIAAALRGDDSPRRVDVIEGGDGPVVPRRVIATAAPAAEAEQHEVPDAADEQDPLRAALEELQRVVVPDVTQEVDEVVADEPAAVDEVELDGAAPVTLASRRLRGLPPPPSTPPPGPPPAGHPPLAPPGATGDATATGDRPTLW